MAKKRNYGDITEEQYQTAIQWLEEGGTKKGACDIMRVGSNPIMERLITEYIDRKVIDRELRAKKRKTAVLQPEVAEFITMYLNGYSLSDLSDTFYRSTSVIKLHLQKHGALLRQQETINPLSPPLMPDACMTDSLDPGQYVWSAKYGCIAKVDKQFNEDTYRVMILGDGIRQYSYQHVSELGSLRHLEAIGVNPEALVGFEMTSDEIQQSINRAVLEANKRSKEKT